MQIGYGSPGWLLFPCLISVSTTLVLTENRALMWTRRKLISSGIGYELKNFPVKYIYEPHLAPPTVQEESGCVIGKDYPEPMVDRKAVAKENLAQFKASLN